MHEKQSPASQKLYKLIDTARTLFFKHGVKRVTIEEICERADVSKVTFYRYFANKEDIVPFEDTMAEMKKRFMLNITNAQEKGEVRQDLSPGLIWLAAEKLHEITLDGRWKEAVPDYNELHRQLRTMYFNGLLTK